MSMRERILAVYRGQTPDVVPFMLDLSHWFYHTHHMPWDLSVSFDARTLSESIRPVLQPMTESIP